MSFAYRFDPGQGEQTALVFHGTGGDEHSLVPFAQALMPGAPILSLRGRILERGMPRFFRRFGEGVFDYVNIREEADALAEFLPPLAEELGVDPHQMVAIGYSNGANMALAALLRHPNLWQTGVLFRPMVTLTPAGTDPVSALEHDPHLAGKRIFLSAGEQDPIVPPQNTEALFEQLQRAGAEVEIHWHPGGHDLARPEIEAAKQFLGWV